MNSRRKPQDLPGWYLLIVGWVMRQAIWAGRRQILKHRFDFTFEVKNTEGRENDRTANADRLAQRAILRWLRFWLRLIGILSEEDGPGHSLPCRLPIRFGDLRFVVDPLDGSKLYVKGELSRVSVQAALVEIRNGAVVRVLAAYVCDVSVGQMYGYDLRSGGRVDCYARRDMRLRRIRKINMEGPNGRVCTVASVTDMPRQPMLAGQRIVSRAQSSDLSAAGETLLADLLEPSEFEGLFKTPHFIGSGSPTVAAMMAMRGTAAGMVLVKHQSSIWDSAPFVGIMQRLGFLSYVMSEDGQRFEAYEEPMRVEPFMERLAVIWIHNSLSHQLHEWAAARARRLSI